MQKGRFYHSPLFAIRFVESEGHSYIGAIVPGKVAKTAVLRNKLRRSIYQGVRKIYSRIKPNLKIAIMAKNGILTENQETIDVSLEETFLKAKLLN